MIASSDEQNKREELNKILIELAKSQDILKEYEVRKSFFERLEAIYHNTGKDNFRHYYSDIFSVLSLLTEDESSQSLDILSQNILIIKENYKPDENNKDQLGNVIDVSREISKLYDHTNLDISRIRYTDKNLEKYNSKLEQTKTLLRNLEEKYQKSDENLKKLSEDNIKNVEKLSGELKNSQQSIQKDYVVILGIFASIVLSFTGAFTFSSSVLSDIGNVSVYRLVLVALVIGLILFNLISLLVYFISDIIDCKNIISKEQNKKIIFWGGNTILIFACLGVSFAYKYDWFEQNRRTQDNIIRDESCLIDSGENSTSTLSRTKIPVAFREKEDRTVLSNKIDTFASINTEKEGVKLSEEPKNISLPSEKSSFTPVQKQKLGNKKSK